MRRTASLLLAALMIALALAGCLGGATPKDHAVNQAPRRIGSAAPGVAVPDCTYKFDGSFSTVCVDGAYKEKPFVRTYLSSKLDGADIEVGYWLPDVPEGMKVPVIAVASPYFGSQGTNNMAKKGEYILPLTTNFIQHGYAVAGISVRGTGESGGCMDLMGKKETADLDQAITWLGEQSWSSGSVGLIGLSYDGSTPWTAAATGNKYLKTIVPISGVPDVYGLMFKNGSAESRGPILLNALYYGFFARTDATPGQAMAVHTVQGVVCPESLEGFGASLYSGADGERDPLGWWAERNRKPLVEKNYHGSVFAVQGLQDWNVDPSMNLPWLDQLNRSGLVVHQLLGQWNHAYPDEPTKVNGQTNPLIRFDFAQNLLNWFDVMLKGQTGIGLGPSVTVMDSEKRWRMEDSWPPHDATWTTYNLGGGNKLTLEPGAAGSIILAPSPLVGEAAAGAAGTLRSVPFYSADFSTPALAKDMRIAGLPRFHVTISPKGPTGHIAAWLYKVDNAGKEVQIGRTQMDLRFYDGSEKARTLVPNQPVLAMLEFQPMDAYVRQGERLLVRAWEYQDTDRLPAIPPEPVELVFGGSTKSTLELPLIERGLSDYFLPPAPTG